MHNGILLVTNEDRIEFTNQAFCDIFGLKNSPADLSNLSSNELIEKIRFSYINPDAAIKRINEIVRLGQPVQTEDIRMSNGRTLLREFIPIHLGEKKYGRLWNHTDITDRKKAEQALRESEEKYRLLVEYAPTAIYEIDFIDNRFKTVNDGLCRMLGYTETELLGMNPLEIWIKKAGRYSLRESEKPG